jgi:excisionase family DNA binding protein
MSRKVKDSAAALAVDVQPLLTIDQVAKLLCVSRVTVYDMIHNEGLPSVPLRKRIRVRPSSLQQWLVTREQVN